MKILSELPVDVDYTKISNNLLDDPRRFDVPVAWLVLLSLHRYAGWRFLNNRKFAEKLGIPYNSLRKHLYTLRDMGLVTLGNDLVLKWDCEAVQARETKPVKQEEKTISTEVSQMPKTEKRIPKAERWKMIKMAWDEAKPEHYNLAGGNSDGIKIAINAHMKRLSLDSDDYETFIGAVLRGCSVDDWWSSKAGMTMKGVFGFGQSLEDRKYEQVERLYRAGLTVSKPKPKVVCSSDEELLQYAISKDPLCDVSTVARYTVASKDEAIVLMSHIKDERDIPLGYTDPDSLEVRYRREAVQNMNISVDANWKSHNVLLILEDKEGAPLAWSVHAPLPSYN